MNFWIYKSCTKLLESPWTRLGGRLELALGSPWGVYGSTDAQGLKFTILEFLQNGTFSIHGGGSEPAQVYKIERVFVSRAPLDLAPTLSRLYDIH